MTVNKEKLLKDMETVGHNVSTLSRVAGSNDENELRHWREKADLDLQTMQGAGHPGLGPLSSLDEKKGDEFLDRAKNLVQDWYNDNELYPDTVYIVWFAYVLGNWKALVSTSISDGRYHEVTFSANYHEIYHDVYEKRENHTHSA